MNKRVLILVNHDVVIYNFRKELVERLLSSGYKVYISSPYGERIDDLVDMGCEYLEVDIDRRGTNPINELKLIRYYIGIMNNVKPDVVLTYTIKPNIYGGWVAKRCKIPYIANVTGLGTAVENNGLLQKITIILYKLAFAKIKRVFFQNVDNMEFFERNKIAVNKHKLIPGSGVNLSHFTVLDYPSDKTVEFVFISRIMKAKGIDEYLHTAKYMRARYHNTRFHICGFCEEEYEEVLRDMHDIGIIIYHGMVRDVREILMLTHCTIHPTSYPEGISNVLLESAACGRPIITTNRSGCREVVEHGVNGLMIKQKDARELIETVQEFYFMDYKKKKLMGLHGREKVVKQFDRRFVVEAYMNEINNLSS